jgi:hypothetical protein
MLYFLTQYWPVPLLLLSVFMSGDSLFDDEDRERAERDREWAAHPMNPEGMNYMGD